MPDEHSNGNDDSGRRRPDGRVGPPPVLNLLLWAIVIAAVPLTIVVWQSGQQDVKTISQSVFEKALIDGRVKSAVVKIDPATGRRTISGDYQVDTTQATTRPYSVEVIFSERLENMLATHCPDNREVETVSQWIPQLLFSIGPIILLIVVIYFLFARQIKSAGKSAIQFGKSRAKINHNVERITFADLAGVEEAQEEVGEIIEFLKDPERFHRLGGRLPRGVLMIGPPGTGKTLLARAIAGEADVPFFSISGSDFVEMFVGVGASRVRDMFDQAKKDAPCIIFIDEIDAVGRSRFSGIGGGHDEREQTLNALLVEMDGFEGKTGVIVIAATNRPDVLDPALLRPGRFDRQINVDLPDVKGRLGILNVHAKKVKMGDNVDLEIVARGTPGFSGADLANVINEAALLAARMNRDAVTMAELEEARDKICWGKERRSRQVDGKDREVTAYHEAGHALLALHCEHATPLHKVTIIPRGNALGATFSLPQRDRYTQTRAELIDQLTVLMGGRFAEQIIFDEVTSGAAMDIQQATQIARKMVCEWGMSEAMGLLNYGGREQHIYVGRDITRHEDYSESTARSIDIEVKKIIDFVATRAETLLTQHKDQLVALGKALLADETLDVKEIRKLLGMPADHGDPRFFSSDDSAVDNSADITHSVETNDTDGTSVAKGDGAKDQDGRDNDQSAN